ncbi:MAG: glycosyltransferase [Patescibacteria group bacterium]|nr:glycosyltransferase [Patescibacteria group bacterium]
MSSIKKILFVSCSAGSGHTAAANALFCYGRKNYPLIEFEHVDINDYTGKLMKNFFSSFYDFLIRHFPNLYGAAYYATDSFLLPDSLPHKMKSMFRVVSGKFLKKIKESRPDLIVSTYFLPPHFLPSDFKIPIDVVITDYRAHKFWFSSSARKFFVATEEMKKTFEKKGMKALASGLPVNPEFFKQKNIAELKNKLGIKKEWPTILLKPSQVGGINSIDMTEAAEKILEIGNLNLIAISGKNNKELYRGLKNIKEIPTTRYIPLEYADNIDEWKRIAKVVITKPGGMTTAECLFLNKPMIIINPIPGQEEHNAEFLVKNNFGVRVDTIEELVAETKKALLKTPSENNNFNCANPNEIIFKNLLGG